MLMMSKPNVGFIIRLAYMYGRDSSCSISMSERLNAGPSVSGT